MSEAWNSMRASLHASSRARLRAVRAALVKRRYRENGNVDHRNDKGSGSDLREPNEASTVKVATSMTPQYCALIDKSPFAALATCGPEGWIARRAAICPAFVRVHDDKDADDADRRATTASIRCATSCMTPGSRCCF